MNHFIPGMLIALSLLFSSPAIAGELAGHIDAIMGEVHLTRGDIEIPVALQAGVEVGDHVSTGKTSRVRIVFNDGSSMQLGQHAEAVIDNYATGASDGALDALISLIEGRGRFIVEKLKNKDAKYRIRTRAVLIGVRGTDILAQANNYISHVALAEGHIQLSRPGAAAEVALNKGQYLLVVGKWPPAPQAIPEQWLNDFINDVGTSDAGARKKKGGSGSGDISVPTDAIQQKMLNQMGSPMVVPQ
ncbi:MAG: hypothetical protein AUK36_00760 [Zetaproteobacteria bacterium CG2_30_59_37]|nr:MAG: hypothetical protein AUK36_00760 [Zetaproteobacteria bacterium CG2_30_59_37]